MTTADITTNPFSTPELLSHDNIAAMAKGLPLKMQMILRALLHLKLGSLRLTLPDGRSMLVKGHRPGPDAAVTLHNWNLPQRALTGGTIAVAESYMDGDWESPDAGAFLELFLVNADVGSRFSNGAQGLLRLVERFRHWMNANTRTGSKRNISAHYDLGNAFYSQWLDPSMTYSSALYSRGANDLRSAQMAKYRALAEATGIGPNDHVLEIGCGWGGFAEFAASEIGCKVTGLTISREQLAFASERMRKAGLSDKVELKFQDYRDEQGRYDRIVSIEMFEAVGEKYWTTYFSKVRECLKPGGRAGLQIITILQESYRDYRDNPDFIQKYVFPGGTLPSEARLAPVVAAAGLGWRSVERFGRDYSHTLSCWSHQFETAWSTIRRVSPRFDERFRRLWLFYLAYCEAGFQSGRTDVIQLTLGRPA